MSSGLLSRSTSAPPEAVRLWRRPQRPDPLLLLGVVLLLGMSGLLVASTTAHLQGGSGPFLARHFVTMGIGLVLAAVAACCGRRLISMLIVCGYPLLLLLLVAVRFAGHPVNGSRSWIDLPGGFSLQPSELAKLAVVCVLAWWFARRRSGEERPRWTDFLVALVLAGVPVALILAQPDLGTVLVLSITVFVVLAVAGAGWRLLVPLVLLAATAVVSVIRAGLLADYQVDRFTAFLDPGADVRGIGYNTHQAQLAISSGGLLGKGIGHGPATQGGYVPAQHTDFVFSAAGEELGFIGAGLLVLALTLVVARIIAIGRGDTDRFSQLVCAGVATWFSVQGFENIAMCLQLAPVTGVPLPLVSYGGTSMIACLTAVGLVVGIAGGRPRG
jgi:rod shape determining protein RodA